MRPSARFVRWFDTLSKNDVAIVGGKNASLGELTRSLASSGIRVPEGFATTANAFWYVLEHGRLREQVHSALSDLEHGERTLADVGRCIRDAIIETEFPSAFVQELLAAYEELCHHAGRQVEVAVRSSATAEDLPDASFAGQQESFLNVRGPSELLDACRRCMASLFTDRAISYRQQKGFDQTKVALSIGVQRMVRSDRGASGVLFTLDPDTGFPDVVVINGSWGLGESVVKGTVNPDQFIVFKPLLDTSLPILEKQRGTKAKKLIYAASSRRTREVPTTAVEQRAFVLDDDEILQLALWGRAIERHYGKPMDVEWAKDGVTGELFVVQARPETVHSRAASSGVVRYQMLERGTPLVRGVAIGEMIATGPVVVVLHPEELDRVPDGAILVTEATDPDWVPAMKRVAGIVTDSGGRTCHAAIVARELGIPAIVGTGNGSSVLHDGKRVTLSCAEGESGVVYDGTLRFAREEVSLNDIPKTETKVMLNLATPGSAFRWWKLPADGVGLARMEFIISDLVKVHPLALVRYDELQDPAARKQIDALTAGYATREEYFVDELSQGIARIAAAHYPRRVIVRMSDFKTNEYAELIGGRQFEPAEANPMIGWRGASRYYSADYAAGFALECRAMKRVREEIGLRNVALMIPFCRTVDEAIRVEKELERNGLVRGMNDLELFMMCEIPSNVILAAEFAKHYNGFSIGSNDLTQLVLGIDRDSARLSELFDERNEAVKRMIAQVIATAHACGRSVGICGQAPSDYPEFAAFLVDAGIDSISLNPDSFIEMKKVVAEAERRRMFVDTAAASEEVSV